MNVEFSNLTESQAKALEDLFAVWNLLATKQKGRWTAFFADGQFDFEPEIKVNGEEAKKYMGDIGWRVGKVGFKTEDSYLDDDMYLMDYERIQKILDKPSED